MTIGKQKGKQEDELEENDGFDQVAGNGDKAERFGCRKDLFKRNQGWCLDFWLEKLGRQCYQCH